MSKTLQVDWLEALTGRHWNVLDAGPVSGGCISDARRLKVRDDQDECDCLFVKQNAVSFLSNFECESRGLELLREADVIRTPKVMACGTYRDQAYLVLQWIGSNVSVSSSDYAKLGEQLAKHHKATAGNRIGLNHNNFLGATIQRNEPVDDWNDFVMARRITPQVRMAYDAGRLDASTKQLLETWMLQIPKLLEGRESTTSLIHGDLWSGNYWFDDHRQPVWIDPAVYYGCREAEFGMILLFGNCPHEFFEAYNQTWPLPSGWRQRATVYVAYHLLNHLNLFGISYVGPLRDTVSKALRTL